MDRSQALSLVMLFMFGMPAILTAAQYLPIDADIATGFFVAATAFFVLFWSGAVAAKQSSNVLMLAAALAIGAPAIAYRCAQPLSLSNSKLGSFKLSTDVAELRSAVSTFRAFEPVLRLLSLTGSAPPRLVLHEIERDDIEQVAEMPVSLLAQLSNHSSSSLGATGGTMQLLFVRTTRRVKGENVVVSMPVLVPPVAADETEHNEQAPKPVWHPAYEPTDAELNAVPAPNKRGAVKGQPTIWLSGELIPFDIAADAEAVAEYRLKKKLKNVRPMALLVNGATGVNEPESAYPVLAYAALTAPLALLAAQQFFFFFLALGERPRQTSKPTRAILKKRDE